MRALLTFAFLLPCPALAEAIAAQSRITDVTVYPYGAEITREITFDAPAGSHDLTVSDLPEAALNSPALRLAPAEGLTVGAYSLRADGGPTVERRLSAAEQAARARVKALEAEERTILGRIEGINARIEAADAKAGFLRGLGAGQADLGTATAESLQGIADMIAAEVLAIREEGRAAKAELLEAQAALAELQADLARARTAYDTVATPDAAQPVLNLSVATAAAGQTTLRVTYIVGEAYWAPVYDIELRRKEGKLSIARGVVVSQATGEDWTDVKLTLSTARISDQSEPSRLWPEYRRIVKEQPPEAARPETDAASPNAYLAEPVAEEEVVVEERALSAVAGYVGDTTVYRYDPIVDVATGTENLRLSLDRLEFEATAEAVAVPRLDRTAYLRATFTNTGNEILLPGTAYLFRDGALISTADIEALAPGVEAYLDFGPIEGLRLTRDMPLRAEGERGILTTSNQIEERAILKVENNTAEAWPVRLIDQVPYSEQEDLEITWTASPAPTETDIDGQRGILAWEFDLAPGATQEVALEHLMSWPEGMILQ